MKKENVARTAILHNLLSLKKMQFGLYRDGNRWTQLLQLNPWPWPYKHLLKQSNQKSFLKGYFNIINTSELDKLTFALMQIKSSLFLSLVDVLMSGEPYFLLIIFRFVGSWKGFWQLQFYLDFKSL